MYDDLFNISGRVVLKKGIEIFLKKRYTIV